MRIPVVLIGVLIVIARLPAQEQAFDGATRADWPHYGGTQSAWRYSALDQVDTTNVRNLAAVWVFQTGLQRLATPRVVTASAAGDTMPALVVSNGSQSAIYYDLTAALPVLRTTAPGSVKFADGSTWRHASVIGSYADGDLDLILKYLRAIVANNAGR